MILSCQDDSLAGRADGIGHGGFAEDSTQVLVNSIGLVQAPFHYRM